MFGFKRLMAFVWRSVLRPWRLVGLAFLAVAAHDISVSATRGCTGLPPPRIESARAKGDAAASSSWLPAPVAPGKAGAP